MDSIIGNLRDTTLLLKSFAQSRKYVSENPWIWKYILLAICTNIVVFFGTALVVWLIFFGGFNLIIDSLGLQLPGIVTFFLSVVLWVASLVVTISIFSIVSSIANAPVYGHMTERIIQEKSEYLIIEQSIGNWESMRLTASLEIKKLVLNIVILLVSSTINIVPVIGSVLFILINVLQLIVITGVDIFEPILMYKKLPFRKKLSLFNQNIFLYWPFLIITGVVIAIPVVNIIALPFFQIAAIFVYINRPLVNKQSPVRAL